MQIIEKNSLLDKMQNLKVRPQNSLILSNPVLVELSDELIVLDHNLNLAQYNNEYNN